MTKMTYEEKGIKPKKKKKLCRCEPDCNKEAKILC